ncbi:MAG: O-antigen ligase family protein [Hyphomonadaceae bacterium]|nr:O-antigen ligase family protein [Hyphomonadaceae bacterium]
MGSAASGPLPQTWRSRLVFVVWGIVLLILPLVSHAGGLGMAPLAAIIGGAGLLVSIDKINMMAIPAWLMAITAFLFWAFLSQIWSPYQNSNTLSNPFKLGFGVVLYLGSLLTTKWIIRRDHHVLGWLVIFVAGLALTLLAVDVLTGYALTRTVDPVRPGETISTKNLRVIMNLGHGVAVLSVLLPIAMWALWIKAGRYGYVALVLPTALIGLSSMAGLTVGIVAPIMSIIIVYLACQMPEFSLRSVFILAGLTLIFAPVLGVLSSMFIEQFGGVLPRPWEHRLVMWAYSTEKILEQPWIGHGFDAVRTFDRVMDHPDFPDWRVMSLHPHNFGLHIWLETGLVGIILAVTALLFIRREAIQYASGDRFKSGVICGVMISLIIIGNVSYGVWQHWLWALVFFATGLLRLVFRVTEKTL